MRQANVLANPFVMMTDPEVILRAMERSDRLQGLQRRVCRPLDRPLIPKRSAAMEAADLAIDMDTDDSDSFVF